MTSKVLDITRRGREFLILDDCETRSWNYWEQQFASGVWEPETFSVLDDILQLGHTFVDLGAWVGPITLWAAEICDHVIAIEPDPSAAAILLGNIGMNTHNVLVWPTAVTSADRLGDDRVVTLRNRSAWGNSGSTIIDPELYLRHAEGDTPPNVQEVDVAASTIEDVLNAAGPGLGLVKIDIEGGEELIADDLALIPCPFILSLHLPWLRDPDTFVQAVHALGHVTYLDASDHRFPVVLVTP